MTALKPHPDAPTHVESLLQHPELAVAAGALALVVGAVVVLVGRWRGGTA